MGITSFKEFATSEELVEYLEYCKDVDSACQIVFGDGDSGELTESLSSIKSEIINLFNVIKNDLGFAWEDLKMSVQDIAKAFKAKSVFEALKYFSFSINDILNAIHDITSIPSDLLIRLFSDLRKVESIKNLDERSQRIDEILSRNPVVNLITGPVVAGLLLLIWLNMTFTGNLKYDMHIASWFKALKGDFSIHDLFVSSRGMSMLSFLALGLASGGVISVAWLGSSVYNLALAITYVIVVNAKIKRDALLRFKNYIMSKIRGTKPTKMEEQADWRRHLS